MSYINLVLSDQYIQLKLPENRYMYFKMYINGTWAILVPDQET